MSFNYERMKKVRFMPAQLNDAVTIHIILEVEESTLARLVPSPLIPSSPPRVHFVMNYFGSTTLPGVENYHECALLIEVVHEGIKGNLTLAMLLDDDNAMIGGREFFGFPKKFGLIKFDLHNSSASGRVSRRDVTVAEFKCRFGEEMTVLDGLESPFGATSYNIKCFPDPDLRKFDYPPRLIRNKLGEKLKRVTKLEEIDLLLQSSQYDPWAEILPFTVIEGFKREYDMILFSGEIVAELDGNDYFKHALNRFI